MEEMKSLEEVFKADPRMICWRSTLESDHEKLSEIQLRESVPEDIQNYFATIKNVCLYGRFVYAFYGLAHSLTYLLLEFALKKRLRRVKHDRKRSFEELLRRAIKLGLIKDEGFLHVRRMREHQAEMAELFHGEGAPAFAPPKPDAYSKILIEVLPNGRNRVAHPEHQAIVFPHEARRSVRFAADFINQLFLK